MQVSKASSTPLASPEALTPKGSTPPSEAVLARSPLDSMVGEVRNAHEKNRLITGSVVGGVAAVVGSLPFMMIFNSLVPGSAFPIAAKMFAIGMGVGFGSVAGFSAVTGLVKGLVNPKAASVDASLTGANIGSQNQ